jgi:predicted DNA-binding protein (MmcQ/YjbR family)
MKNTPLERVRRICLALPETTEKIAWGTPTWRVRDRIFVMYSDNHHGDGRVAIWCNAAEGAQKDLVEADPEHIFVPAYVGKGGWIGVRLDRDLPWPSIQSLIEEAYRVTAAKAKKGRGRTLHRA